MKNLDDELRDLSPLLRDLKRKGDGLRLPEGYFDHLEAQVFERLDTLGDRQPWIPTEQPIQQPYNLLGRFLTRQPWVMTNPTVHRAVRAYIRPWPRALPALAAGLALVAAAVWFFRPVAHQAPLLAQVTMPDLSEDDIETYVLENVHDFDAEQLATLTPVAIDDAATEEAVPPKTPPRSKRQQALDDLRPEDLDDLLDGLNDEDLEKLL